MFRPNLLAVLATLATTVLGMPGRAQCDLAAVPGDPLAHLLGSVRTMALWDPDGTGPLPLQLVAAGTFDVAGVYGEHVVMWDGTAWTATQANFGEVTVLAVYNGALFAAADESIWTFDGTTWSVFASVEEGSIVAPVAGVVRALQVFNGALVVGGRFTRVVSPFAPPVTANAIAAYNGTAWTPFGPGPTTIGSHPPTVTCATVFNGLLWVGGNFSSNPAGPNNLETWNPANSTWTVQSAWNGPIDALSVRLGQSALGSYLYAAGRFTTVTTGATVLASPWLVRLPAAAGSSWETMGLPITTGTKTGCEQVFVRGIGINNYELAVSFTTNASDKVWRWAVGTGWTALPNVPYPSTSTFRSARIGFHGGRYVCGTAFTIPGQRALRGHDTAVSAWLPLRGPGFDESVYAVCDDGAELVIGGAFRTISGTGVNGIARGHAGAWQQVGPGFDGVVYAIARMPNGDLVAGGDFDMVTDGTPAANIARWNGSTWSPLGSGVNGDVLALLALPNGELIAGGRFFQAGGQNVGYLARWNGSSWSSVGGGCSAWVYSLLLRPNGDIVVGGAFGQAGGQAASNVALWNGTSFIPLGNGLSSVVWALANVPGGFCAGGEFQHSGGLLMPYLAKWDGMSWQKIDPAAPPPGQPILGLATLPGGELAVTGTGSTFATPSGSVTTCAAIWRGYWESLDVRGLTGRAITMRQNGSLAIGGDFERVGTTISNHVAHVVSTCPATAVGGAPGCASSGGANTLTALSLPWANGTFATRATGLPTNALVVVLTSVTAVAPPLPLSLVFAEGMPGCNLHVAPDIMQLTVAAGGAAQSQFFLPDTPPIVGVTFHQQMMPIEFHPVTGAWLAITATNSLQLTGGAF